MTNVAAVHANPGSLQLPSMGSQIRMIATSANTFALQITLNGTELLVHQDHLGILAAHGPVQPALRSLNCDRYELVRPLPLVIERDDEGRSIAIAEAVTQYASGVNATDAMDNLRSEIVELLDELRAQSDRLAPGMQAMYDQLLEWVIIH